MAGLGSTQHLSNVLERDVHLHLGQSECKLPIWATVLFKASAGIIHLSHFRAAAQRAIVYCFVASLQLFFCPALGYRQ